MDGGITNGLAAILGALAGGLASVASTWMSERTRHRQDLLQREITKRETTYAEFIDHASKLYVMSATHKLDDNAANIESELEGVVSLYGIASRIRLFASDRVIKEAEAVARSNTHQFGAENISLEELREKGLEEPDPLARVNTDFHRFLGELPFRNSLQGGNAIQTKRGGSCLVGLSSSGRSLRTSPTLARQPFPFKRRIMALTRNA